MSVILISVFTLLLGLSVGSYGGLQGWFDWMPYYDDVDEGSSTDRFIPAKYNVDLGLFWTVWDILDDEYLREENLDMDTMTYGAISGMVNSLGDPYTVFMNPDETEEFTKSLDGELEGIGAELTVTDDHLAIVTPLKNSPAEKAGLLPEDIIYKIEDEFAADLTLFDAIMKIRGASGTPIELTIIRDGVADPFEVTIVRARIDLESVSYEAVGENIAYVSINQFTDGTADDFGKIIGDLILDEPDGLIIDLRYNGGGYLDSAIDVLSYLLKSDVAASSIRERDGEDSEEILYTNGGEKLLKVPLVVLVNAGSASASEIVAGAIQDHERGVIMGAQSFGKGTVQAVEFLEDGSSIRLTIAQWFTPSGRAIQDVGIKPDIRVENSIDESKEGVDRQLNEAIKYLERL